MKERAVASGPNLLRILSKKMRFFRSSSAKMFFENGDHVRYAILKYRNRVGVFSHVDLES